MWSMTLMYLRWKGMEGDGRRGKAMEGDGRRWKEMWSMTWKQHRSSMKSSVASNQQYKQA